MLGEKISELGLDGLGQQRARALPQDFGELIIKGSWLNQLEHGIVGHGISLLRWRSGGVKHPHDMPPFRFAPSPTFSDSSSEGFTMRNAILIATAFIIAAATLTSAQADDFFCGTGEQN
jgi:hypothetical protein